MARTSNPNIYAKIDRFISPASQNFRDIFSREYFKQRLSIEKRRTERLNSQATIVLVCIQCLYDGIRKKLKQPEHQLIDILESLSPKIRISDVACLYEKNIIAFLLPDTNYSGAEVFWERISGELIKIIRKQNITDKIVANDFELEILTYPEKKYGTTQSVESINAPPPPKSNISPKDSTTHYHETLNLGMYSSNGFSIAIPFVDSIFWDDQIFSGYISSIKKMSKRSIDILGSLFGIILLSPILFLISILIKLTSPGPVFYQQQRIGFKGKIFKFWKFRSMRCNCDDKLHQEYVTALIKGETQKLNNGSHQKPLYKIKKDPRVTRLGQFLRDYSLDELPQLWNVLKGEMSLVGPRPPIPYEVNEYKNWHYRRLTAIKPGITGLWQVYGRNQTSFDDMVRLDIHYLENWTLWMDISIIFKTFTVLHQGK